MRKKVGIVAMICFFMLITSCSMNETVDEVIISTTYNPPSWIIGSWSSSVDETSDFSQETFSFESIDYDMDFDLYTFVTTGEGSNYIDSYESNLTRFGVTFTDPDNSENIIKILYVKTSSYIIKCSITYEDGTYIMENLQFHN